MIKRKLFATLITTIVTSWVMSLLYLIDDEEVIYHKGNEVIGWFWVFFMYIGVIVLIYGNAVSFLVAYLQRKWFPKTDWLYVAIVGVLGLGIGFLFPGWQIMLGGVGAALVYAYMEKGGYIWRKSYLLIFVLLPCITWGYLEWISPPVPPFTKEEAVASATSVQDVPEEHFPKKIGEWKGAIDGYQVKRKTSAKEIGNEVYLVRFTETWKKGTKKGSWSFSYRVERGVSSANDEKGDMPPYYLVK